MTQAVLLDLGNVIVPVDFSRCHAAVAEVSPYPACEIQQRLAAGRLVEQFETGEIEPDDFMRQACAALAMDIDYPRFWAIWDSIFLPDALIPEEWLEGLRRRTRLLLLSNTNSIHFSRLRESYPQLRHFDDYVLSYQVGALKPSAAIYRQAVARAGFPAGECFFTDDIPAYVAAARQEGLDAVPFQNFEQLRAELQQRGIDC